MTVRAKGLDLPRFRALTEALGVKHVLIELPSGDTAAQPMTSSIHRGALAAVEEQVAALAGQLTSSGFEVIRTKIEALPHNSEIPETDAEARLRPGGYFEYHLKLALPAGDAGARGLVERAVGPLGARLSRNANALPRPGEEHRFVTLRVPGVGRAAAEQRFEALVSAVEGLGFPIKSRVREYTVVDSDLRVDHGW